MSEAKNEQESIIKKITLKIGKETINLTIDEAKKLNEALGELFGAKKEVEHIHHHDHDYWYCPYRTVTWGGNSYSIGSNEQYGTTKTVGDTIRNVGMTYTSDTNTATITV